MRSHRRFRAPRSRSCARLPGWSASPPWCAEPCLQNRRTTRFAAPTIDFDLLLKKPVLRISFARTSGRTAAKSSGVGYFFEKAGSDFVDALVGALRGEDGRDQELPGIVMQQGAGGLGVHDVEAAEDFRYALLALGCGLGTFHVSS